MVIATGIAAITGEETALALAKGDAEVVGRRVHGNTHVLDHPAVHSRAVFLITGLKGSKKQVQTTHAWMSVAGEIQQAIGAHVGETFVALGVDLRTQIL